MIKRFLVSCTVTTSYFRLLFKIEELTNINHWWYPSPLHIISKFYTSPGWAIILENCSKIMKYHVISTMMWLATGTNPHGLSMDPLQIKVSKHQNISTLLGSSMDLTIKKCHTRKLYEVTLSVNYWTIDHKIHGTNYRWWV